MRGEVGRYAPFEVRVWSNVPQTKDERRDEIGEVRRLEFVIQEAEPIESIR